MAKRTKRVITTSGQPRPAFTKLLRDSKTFDKDFKVAMYFIHYELSEKDLKKAVITYAKSEKLDHKALDALPGHSMMVLGKACHVINSKGELPDDWKAYLDEKIEELTQQGIEALLTKKEEKKASSGPVLTIQDRLRDMAAAVASDFDGMVDEFILNPAKFKPDAEFCNYKELENIITNLN